MSELFINIEVIRDAFRKLFYNLFTINLKEINDKNLSTLKITEPEVYDIIKRKEIRRALIKSGLFEVAVWKSPKAKQDLEIGFDTKYHRDRLLFELRGITQANLRKDIDIIKGENAATNFLKSLYILTKALWEVWGNEEQMKIIQKALEMETINMYPSRIKKLLDRIRIDARVLLDNWKKVSKELKIKQKLQQYTRNNEPLMKRRSIKIPISNKKRLYT